MDHDLAILPWQTFRQFHYFYSQKQCCKLYPYTQAFYHLGEFTSLEATADCCYCICELSQSSYSWKSKSPLPVKCSIPELPFHWHLSDRTRWSDALVGHYKQNKERHSSGVSAEIHTAESKQPGKIFPPPPLLKNNTFYTPIRKSFGPKWWNTCGYGAHLTPVGLARGMVITGPCPCKLEEFPCLSHLPFLHFLCLFPFLAWPGAFFPPVFLHSNYSLILNLKKLTFS